MLLPGKQLYRRARKVKLFLMDVDGVLSDGKIYFVPSPRGTLVETKSFSSLDGLGIRIAHAHGLKTGIISGRGSPVIEYRVRELGIHFLVQNRRDKLQPYMEILRAAGLHNEDVCYIGDDIVDLPLFKRVGLAVGVADAHPLIRSHVHYITKRPGGRGAVRETVELILTAQGKWDEVVEHYLNQ